MKNLRIITFIVYLIITAYIIIDAIRINAPILGLAFVIFTSTITLMYLYYTGDEKHE